MRCYIAWTYRFRQIIAVGWLHTLFGLLRHPYPSVEHWNKWMHCHAQEAFTCDWKLSRWYSWSLLVCCFIGSFDIKMGDRYQQLYRHIWWTWYKRVLRTCVGWWNVDCVRWQDRTSMEYRGMISNSLFYMYMALIIYIDWSRGYSAWTSWSSQIGNDRGAICSYWCKRWQHSRLGHCSRSHEQLFSLIEVLIFGGCFIIVWKACFNHPGSFRWGGVLGCGGHHPIQCFSWLLTPTLVYHT